MDQSARTKVRESLAALQRERTVAAERYGGPKHSSRNAWEDVKAGFLKSYHELCTTLLIEPPRSSKRYSPIELVLAVRASANPTQDRVRFQ
jgi:hypothetical protein